MKMACTHGESDVEGGRKAATRPDAYGRAGSRYKTESSNGQHPPDRRTSTKLVRFTPSELATVILRATECGRPVACYIREAALGVALHARRTPVNDVLIRKLSRLAIRLSSLEQNARELQLSGASEFECALSELLATIRSVE